ncbi:MAG: dienelactone hydrolase family protein [Candidatus Pelagibacter bacterium]|jgi:phospholipase/carboxylesterase|nr:dienelactone hydrolase family protein [Pelagibacterales bacterium]MBL6799415.1 dienelactone hydrolase family protein [Candidatus Pelagibacter bacterium]MDA7751001.1 dienelactone hydrolase family protein [Candidatus Pelagibacter sp.]MBL6862362.1 dienelactone hydrolase family protein [Candidatus Pelagibacter bacterium]MDA8533085.1 dienelactone hydrolase family protein [Candidatus Pelagibacter bacterium]|tara:strand:+ start:281 stop:937 length:657 start_codon:yes stop_codon:yes gene_type:complete
MTFCLSTTIVNPEKDIPIKYAVILLHGYGGDGKDISMLTLNWKRFLPNAIFLCPNGHEKCEINPGGYQWFDLTKDDPEYILEQSKKAETKLHEFIEEIKEKYNLENSQICLSGFSQGCMMSINLGLTSNENYNCVVGFSGKIINQDDLKKRKKSLTKMFLIHGDKDAVVSPTHLLEAKDFLIRNNVEVETKMIENCEHHIPIEASSAALNYIKNSFNI